jgi:hypothetical protein
MVESAHYHLERVAVRRGYDRLMEDSGAWH